VRAGGSVDVQSGRQDSLPAATAGAGTHERVHLAVQAVAEDEVVRELHAVRLHGVAGAIVIVPDVRCTWRRGQAKRHRLRLGATARTGIVAQLMLPSP